MSSFGYSNLWTIAGLVFQNQVLGLIINIVLMSGFDSRDLRLTLLRPSKLSLASTTKSFLTTHYASPRFPVRVEDICLPNGLKLGYFDTQLKIWPARLPKTQKATFAHHCQFTMPANSPLSSLNFLTDFAMDLKGPSSYEIVLLGSTSMSTCRFKPFSLENLDDGLRFWLSLGLPI
jgi:hypothetical protein